jgi:hypothetical protein
VKLTKAQLAAIQENMDRGESLEDALTTFPDAEISIIYDRDRHSDSCIKDAYFKGMMARMTAGDIPVKRLSALDENDRVQTTTPWMMHDMFDGRERGVIYTMLRENLRY